jgi:hypothetical protein
VIGMRPSICGCLAGGSLGGKKSKSLFSVLGVSSWKLRQGIANGHFAHDDARLILVFRPPKNSDLTTLDSGVKTLLPLL